MTDRLSSERRSRNMAAIKARDTKPEVMVRKYLWHHGFRYRVNVKGLPGRPDIVIGRLKVCVFVNGCFWHGHRGCRYFILPKTNKVFWQQKIARNRERDRRVNERLLLEGWQVMTLWECELKPAVREQTLERLLARLQAIAAATRPKHYDITDIDHSYSIAAEDDLYEPGGPGQPGNRETN